MEQCKKIEYASLRELVTKCSDDYIQKDVLNQVSILSLELFGEDAVETYSAPGKAGRLWAMYDFGGSFVEGKPVDQSMASMSTNVSLSGDDDSDEDCPEPGFGGRPRLLGFIIARLMNNVKMPRIGGEALSIVYAGVPEDLRGHGIGKQLVQQVIGTGRERKNIAVVTLSALPGAINFWERCGFVSFPDAMEVKEGMAKGQVYMEANVRGSKGKKQKTNRKKPMFM